MHATIKGYVTKAAALVPAEKLNYRPTPEVRTMGLATKAEIEKALADAMAFCDRSTTPTISSTTATSSPTCASTA